jgi:hypothetical protein
MEKIVTKLMENGITPIIHQLHLGPTLKRNLEYATEVNNLYKDISEKYQLLLIPPVEEFADITLGTGRGLTSNGPGSGAVDENERITKDGEHLWPLGYAIWGEHLKTYLDLIPAGE